MQTVVAGDCTISTRAQSISGCTHASTHMLRSLVVHVHWLLIQKPYRRCMIGFTMRLCDGPASPVKRIAGPQDSVRFELSRMCVRSISVLQVSQIIYSYTIFRLSCVFHTQHDMQPSQFSSSLHATWQILDPNLWFNGKWIFPHLPCCLSKPVHMG
jgi:hypothetical protein